jgi:hypothetical protein
MEPVACLISVRKDELASILVDVGNRVKYFDEHMWEEYRMGRRAHSIIDLRKVRDVRLIGLQGVVSSLMIQRNIQPSGLKGVPNT